MLDKLIEKRSAIVDLLVKHGVAFLIAKLPFLSFGPLGWVISKFMSIYLDKLIVATVREIEVQWSEQDKKNLAESIDTLFSSYDTELDEAKKEQIENEIVEKARELIKIKKTKSIIS